MDKKVKISQYIFALFISGFLTSCTDTISLPAADRTPPQAIIISPVDNESIQGEVNILVRATDNESVDSVQFYINQNFVGTDDDSENDVFEYKWESSNYDEDEYHFISVVAWDIAGNDYASFPIRVIADNTDNEPPTAFIINPFTGQYVSGIVDIIVEATDNDSIQYVSYYVNNVLQGYIQEPPYSFPWNTYLVQDDLYYSIYVIIKDMSNNETTLTPISVIVDNIISADITPPTGSITSPPSGMTVSGEVEIIVSAVDERAMGRVEISINGNVVGIDDEQPYQYTWDTTQEDDDVEHTIGVVLNDLAGNQTVLNPIAVIVDNEFPGDGTQPVVLITEPVAGQSVSGMINIEVIASDESGIDYIEFYIDGDSVSTDDLEPYNFTWDTETVTDDQDHIISVIGFDLAGNAGPATPISVFVDNFDNIAPNGSIISPYAGQTLSGTVSIEISATDNDGVEYVELSINGISRQIFEEYPYVYLWETSNEVDDEYHVISAVISDYSNNLTYVNPISVFINNNYEDTTPPVAVISNPLSGQTVSGSVLFTVLAQDDIGVNEVEFFINGELVGNDQTESFDYNWDTTLLENDSQHTLSATVTDDSGNFTIVQPILVIVEN